MKKGNKAQRAQQQRAQRAARATQRAANRPVKAPAPKPPSPKKLRAQQRAEMDRVFTDPVYLRWVANGVNYLVSDYDSGRWDVLFEGLDQATEMPTPEEIARRVLLHFGQPATGTYEDALMKACITWTVLPRETHYLYYREALHRLSQAAPDTGLEPTPNSVVWKLLTEIKQLMLAA